MSANVTSMKISVPRPAQDPIRLWVERLAAQGVELFLRGLGSPAIAIWKKALLLEPAHGRVLSYLSIVGAAPKSPAMRRPTTVVLTVKWSGSECGAADTKQMRGEAGEELYEVLRDRALCAFHAKSWVVARSLLLACAKRRPDDSDIGLLWDAVDGRLLREVQQRAA